MRARSRTAITCRYKCWRAVSTGELEAAGTVFLLLIAVRHCHAGPKAMVAGGGSLAGGLAYGLTPFSEWIWSHTKVASVLAICTVVFTASFP